SSRRPRTLTPTRPSRNDASESSSRTSTASRCIGSTACCPCCFASDTAPCSASCALIVKLLTFIFLLFLLFSGFQPHPPHTACQSPFARHADRVGAGMSYPVIETGRHRVILSVLSPGMIRFKPIILPDLPKLVLYLYTPKKNAYEKVSLFPPRFPVHGSGRMYPKRRIVRNVFSNDTCPHRGYPHTRGALRSAAAVGSHAQLHPQRRIRCGNHRRTTPQRLRRRHPQRRRRGRGFARLHRQFRERRLCHPRRRSASAVGRGHRRQGRNDAGETGCGQTERRQRRTGRHADLCRCARGQLHPALGGRSDA